MAEREPTPNEIKINLLRQRKYEAAHGDRGAFEGQHEKGKLTARERIQRLVDRNSFVELDIFTRHRAHGLGLENRWHCRPAALRRTRPWGRAGSGRIRWNA